MSCSIEIVDFFGIEFADQIGQFLTDDILQNIGGDFGWSFDIVG